MSKPRAALAHAADGDSRQRKRFPSPALRKIAAAATALVLGAGLAVVGVAAPASAHHNTITGTVVCDTDGSPSIEWTVQNSESEKNETIIDSSDETVVPVGTEIKKSKSATFVQPDVEPGTYTLTLTGEWTNKRGGDPVTKTNSGTVTVTAEQCENLPTVKKVTFCHATGSASNPYVVLTTSVNAFFRSGHDKHQGLEDIYPTFSYVKHGVTYTVEARGDQSLLETGDCTKPLTRIPVPNASFADECGIDNYVLSYDKTLTGVVWTESVADGQVTLTATPADGYAFQNGEPKVVFGPWKLNQKPCDVVVPVPTQASFADECGIDNYVLSYDKTLTGVVWSESVADGQVTLTAKPADGYAFEGGTPEVVFGPWKLNQKPCDEKIAVPVATFVDECGVDNYVLSYDKTLTGVVWSESVADGQVTLTATPADGYAFEGGEPKVVFGPWKLNQTPCVELVPVPTQASFADTCGVDNETLAYDTSLKGVVWAESLADGKLTLTAKPADGFAFIGGKPEVVFGPWAIDDEPCIAPTLDGSVATGVCEANAPWISYTVKLTDPDAQVSPDDRTVSLVLSDGEHTEVIELGDLNDEGVLDGRTLWPGASVDAEGNATGWPGWKQLDNGTWVQTDDNFAWTRDLTSAKFILNPEFDVVLAYPPAAPDCIAAPPVTPGGDGATPSTPAGTGLASTGFAGTTIAIVAGVIVIAGIAFLVIARLRRKQS